MRRSRSRLNYKFQMTNQSHKINFDEIWSRKSENFCDSGRNWSSRLWASLPQLWLRVNVEVTEAVFLVLQTAVQYLKIHSEGWQEMLSQWRGHTGSWQLQSKAVLVGRSFFNSMSCNSFHMSWGKFKLTEFPWNWDDNFLLSSRMELKVKIKL